MAKIKGSGKEIMFRTLQRHGADKKQRFLDEIPAAQRAIVESTLSIRWEEIETDENHNSLQVAAKLLFPNDPKRLRKLGNEMAIYGFSVMYKIFFRLPSLTTLFKKVAAQWAQMYDTGRATVEDIQEHSATLVVRDFPDLPAYLREYLGGFYEGLAKLNGAKNPKVIRDDKDPNVWKWELRWD